MKNDPVKYCEVYLKEGCSHVDGYLCDMNDCSIRKNNEKQQVINLAMQYLDENSKSYKTYKVMCDFVEWLQTS